ncbi:hypothetical protein [uncultured Clostridium sp.]|jgi:hypothetical protein|uniref:hypothetical protein n=1 Tax=uncultured Clostridium sp. TaxID=59620 RepID=UPI00261326C4|nr:hypothetical protein [uncultured Clostridium sp.]
MENESVGIKKLKEVVKESGNKKDLVKLDNFGNFPYEGFSKNIGKVRRLQGKYKLSTGGVREIKLAFKSGMFGLSGIYAMIKGMNVNSEIIKELMSISLDEEGYDYEVPVFYILGENDWQTPSIIAKKYFENIKAPCKKLYMLDF